MRTTSPSLTAALAYVRSREMSARLAGTTLASSVAEAIGRIDSSTQGYSSARSGRLQQVQALQAALFDEGGELEDTP